MLSVHNGVDETIQRFSFLQLILLTDKIFRSKTDLSKLLKHLCTL